MANAGTYSRQHMTLAPSQIETARLTLRPMDLEKDLDRWLQLRMNPEVQRFIGTIVHTDRQVALEETETKKQKGDFKFFYTVTVKEDTDPDEMIGLVIMRPMEDGKTVEVGYWLLPDYWGQGYATEAASAVCRACPDAMGFPASDISAHVMVGNHASRRVLEKSGLKVTSTGPVDLPNGGQADVWWLNWAQE